MDVVDTSASETEMKEAAVIEKETKKDAQISTEITKIKESDKVEMEPESLPKESSEAKTESKQDKESKSQTRTRKRSVRSASTEIEISSVEPKTPITRKRANSRAKSVDVVQEFIETDKPLETKEIEEPKTRKRGQSRAKSIDIETPKETDEPKTPATRKRVTKTNEPEIDETLKEDELKTPITRKRAQSITSNQSEETTPENVTPSRRKTPTTDARKIITRRMSREMKEDSFDESVSLTPKRRTKKVADDNESIASGSSIASSVQSGDSKRRGRKSVVATKPDLSVIPEVLAEESREQSNLDVIHEYSEARR